MSLPDVDDFDKTYGGGLTDIGMPVLDETTDRPAAGMDAALCSTAAMTHTVPRCFATMALSSTPLIEPIVGLNDANWGTSVVATPGHVSTGEFTVTWPPTIVDEEGNTHTLNFRWAKAIPLVTSAGSPPFAQARVSGPSQVTVYIANLVGGSAVLDDFTSGYGVVVQAG